MPQTLRTLPDVFTAREIAKAAGVRTDVVADLIATGALRSVDGEFVAHDDAVDAARRLRDGRPFPIASAAALTATPGSLFARAHGAKRSPGLPAAASAAVHGAMIGGLLLATLVPLDSSAARAQEPPSEKMRLVFLNMPGPGGGGGGGGLRMKTPAPQARREGTSALKSPLPVRKPVVEQPAPTIEEPPPTPKAPEPLPPVEAPVAARSNDAATQAGVLEQRPAVAPSRGSGQGGGAGTGTGTGLGEGQGSGIGDGEGGGEGGGPFRPGSGIQPPRLLNEVKPDYTEDARRRGVEGEVVLEIVVRRDGRVGDVRVLQGLGGGLDQQAIQAVRRWSFAAATRKGRPVDVIVEVAVEFKLR
ncbi:energy transducer TonB [Luteitalea sp.]|jgi:protein TonB|uniref:energy transducer TonB n=1 Tax=Luteitalea sp. TaxID=2004800 RepID=UPI0037C7181A